MAFAVGFALVGLLAIHSAHAIFYGTSHGIDYPFVDVTCYLTTTAPDDPIVYPNQPGASHMHSFFGAENMSASVTSVNQLLTGREIGKASCRERV